MARSGYDAVVGADCVWGITVPGNRDHNREEAYVGTLRVVDDGRGDVDLMTGTGRLRREGREMQEGPGKQHGDLSRMEMGGIYHGRMSCWRGLILMWNWQSSCEMGSGPCLSW